MSTKRRTNRYPNAKSTDGTSPRGKRPNPTNALVEANDQRFVCLSGRDRRRATVTSATQNTLQQSEANRR
jgi:hypothetical protein